MATLITRRSFLRTFIFTGLAMSMTPLGAKTPPAYAINSAFNAKNILTVYYSHTGNTGYIAKYINQTTGGDIVQLQIVTPYPDIHRDFTEQVRRELDSGYKPPLKVQPASIADYDPLFVGSPCWRGTIATPVITFLSSYDFSGKTIIPFMTHEGSGMGRSEEHIRQLCPKATVLEGLAIRGRRAVLSSKEVESWLNCLAIQL